MKRLPGFRFDAKAQLARVGRGGLLRSVKTSRSMRPWRR